MYYQARCHELLPVADATEAATRIKTSNISSYQCPVFKVEDTTIVIVPNGDIDNIFFEVAVLRLEADGRYTQIESITNGWIKSVEELAKYFTDAVKEPAIMGGVGNAKLIIGMPKGDETASFICGCCSEWFKGNVKEQQKFDQDSGIGICDDCSKYYQ